MKRFKNILAVYNHAVRDDDALTQATTMAKINDARLTMIEVDKDADASPAHVPGTMIFTLSIWWNFSKTLEPKWFNWDLPL